MNTPKPTQSGILSWMNIWKITKFCFSLYGVICITLLILIITAIGSIKESITEKTPLPFLKDFGGKILNYEQKLYLLAENLEEQHGIYVDEDGFLGKIKALWLIVLTLGKILFLWWIFIGLSCVLYKLATLIINDDSKVLSAILIAIFFISIIEIASNFVILQKSEKIKIEEIQYKKYLPFQGLYKSIKIFPLIFNPIYEQVKKIEDNV